MKILKKLDRTFTVPTLTRQYTGHNTMEFKVGLAPGEGYKGNGVLYMSIADTGGTKWKPSIVRDAYGNDRVEITLSGMEVRAAEEFARFIVDAVSFLKSASNPLAIDGITGTAVAEVE